MQETITNEGNHHKIQETITTLGNHHHIRKSSQNAGNHKKTGNHQKIQETIKKYRKPSHNAGNHHQIQETIKKIGNNHKIQETITKCRKSSQNVRNHHKVFGNTTTNISSIGSINQQFDILITFVFFVCRGCVQFSNHFYLSSKWRSAMSNVIFCASKHLNMRIREKTKC